MAHLCSSRAGLLTLGCYWHHTRVLKSWFLGCAPDQLNPNLCAWDPGVHSSYYSSPGASNVQPKSYLIIRVTWDAYYYKVWGSQAPFPNSLVHWAWGGTWEAVFLISNRNDCCDQVNLRKPHPENCLPYQAEFISSRVLWKTELLRISRNKERVLGIRPHNCGGAGDDVRVWRGWQIWEKSPAALTQLWWRWTVWARRGVWEGRCCHHGRRTPWKAEAGLCSLLSLRIRRWEGVELGRRTRRRPHLSLTTSYYDSLRIADKLLFRPTRTQSEQRRIYKM